MKVDLNFGGMEDVLGKMRSLDDAVLGETVKEAALAGGAIIAASARQKAPRSRSPKSKGHAADSIAARVSSSTTSRASIKVGPADWGFYLQFLEFGTSKLRAKPWLRPAMDEHKSEAIRVASDVFRQAITKAADAR